MKTNRISDYLIEKGELTAAMTYEEKQRHEIDTTDGSIAAAPVETMTVVMVQPDRPARITTLPHTLEAMQEAVGGKIDAVYPFADPVAILCNEEGKLLGLPLNRGLYDETGQRTRPSGACCGAPVGSSSPANKNSYGTEEKL